MPKPGFPLQFETQMVQQCLIIFFIRMFQGALTGFRILSCAASFGYAEFVATLGSDSSCPALLAGDGLRIFDRLGL